MNTKLALLFFVFSTATANAQVARGGFVGVGVHNNDVEDLNERLAAHGYPTFSENFLSFSGGYNWWTRSLVWSIDGHGLFQPAETNAGYETSLTSAYGLISLGLPIKPAQNVFLYPMISVGGGGAQLHIQNRSNVSFDDLLDDPGRTADVSNASFLFGPRIGAHVLIRLGDKKEAPRGITLGLRGGYLFSAFESEWLELDHESINGGPKMNLGGPHIMFVIGGWGQRPMPPAPAPEPIGSR
jgi:hypothetical protein